MNKGNAFFQVGFWVGLAALGLMGLWAARVTLAAQSTTLIVNTTEDSNDGACDAHCTLREAVVAANGEAGAASAMFPGRLTAMIMVRPSATSARSK